MGRNAAGSWAWRRGEDQAQPQPLRKEMNQGELGLVRALRHPKTRLLFALRVLRCCEPEPSATGAVLLGESAPSGEDL